ncbi:MAG: cyclic 2,3-diphosphoglycerate synthase [Candidatus Methanofastidiosia archaeon]
MGAAGRDFHNFNLHFRDNASYEVIAFTATQIPNIENRKYPQELSGKLYPKGIPIYAEDKLEELISKYEIDEVVFAYSDVSHEYVMHKASLVNSLGADFKLMGSKTTMLKSKIPVISVCAVRTGCGKSQTSRKISEILRRKGLKVVVVRHPMPYGFLNKKIFERYESLEDLSRYECTIEEREEYEPHIEVGNLVFAGVDYKIILENAEKEADLIVWDGGNNDLPFYHPDLHVVVTDPLRVSHELRYYPGETNLRMANIAVINKENSATPEQIEKLERNIHWLNPKAKIIHANSKITLENEKLEGKRVLVVEDGPTLTHGGMEFGAGTLAVKEFGAEIVDAEPYAVGSIKKIYEKYPHLKKILPAMGYSEKQIKELEKTINSVPCDMVVFGTPIDLRRILNLKKKALRVRYQLEEKGKPDLEEVISEFIEGIDEI